MPDPADLDPIVPLIPRIYRALACPFAESHGIPQVTMSQYGAMAFLWRNPGATLSEVARELGITLGSASDLVDRLVEFGLIERKTNPDNRRQVQLSLTEGARARIAEIRHERRRQFERVQAELTRSEWDGFVKGLSAWADVLDEEAPRRHDARRAIEVSGG